MIVFFDNDNHNIHSDFHLQNHHHQQQRKSALTKQTCLSLIHPAAAGPFQLISYQFCVKSSKTLATGNLFNLLDGKWYQIKIEIIYIDIYSARM